MAVSGTLLADKAEAVASYAEMAALVDVQASRYRPIQPARWQAATKITAALISIASAPPTTLRANCRRVICFTMTLSSAPEVIATLSRWFPRVAGTVRSRHRGKDRRGNKTVSRARKTNCVK